MVLDALADNEAEAVLQRVIKAAKRGDLRAAEIILARAWPLRKGRPTAFPLPRIESVGDIVKALGAVLHAVSEGHLSAEEGQSIGAMLEVTRRGIELVEIERRVAALEQKSNQQ